jgi:peptidoglycan/xylan/chitin deacetylase (PgdA/CDA1 family)
MEEEVSVRSREGGTCADAGRQGRKLMRNRIKLWISVFCYYSGLVTLLRCWRQRSGRSLLILYYHRADGENLRKQWLYLRRHYRILPLEAALEEFYGACNDEGQREAGQAQGPHPSTQPPPVPTGGWALVGSESGGHIARHVAKDRRIPLVITFDDGYYDNYTHAFPLARQLQIPITIFLIPGYVDCENAFWWADHLIRLAQVDQVAFEGCTYRLDQQEERKALAQIINDRVCNSASLTERKKVLNAFCALLEVPASAIPEEKPAPLLTWTQVREMGKSVWVTFGAHTIHHADLEHLTDPVEVQGEIGLCRTLLEQELEHPVNTFAYPHGHIGSCGLSAVKQSGYRWAVTILPGFNTQRSNPYLLYRMQADADKHLAHVAAEAAGVWEIFTRLRQGLMARARRQRKDNIFDDKNYR